MPARPSGSPQSDGRTCETCQQPVTRHVSDCAGVRNVRAHAVAAARPVAVWEALGSARGPAAVQSVIDGLEGYDHAPLVSKLRDLQALAGLDPLAPVADPEPWKNSLKMLATTPTAGGRSALTVVVEAIGLARPVEPDQRSDGIFPASLAAVRTVAPDPDTSRVPGRTGRAGTARLCAGRFVMAAGRGRDLGDGHSSGRRSLCSSSTALG